MLLALRSGHLVKPTALAHSYHLGLLLYKIVETTSHLGVKNGCLTRLHLLLVPTVARLVNVVLHAA